MKGAVLFLLFIWVNAQTQDKKSEWGATLAGSIDSVVLQHHQQGKFNGTVLVASGGKIVYQNAVGFASRNTPLTLESTFYLGSLAKQFTAMGVLLLNDDDKLSLDDLMVHFFPELPEFAGKITVRHVLNHTSGLPDYYSLGKFVPEMTNQMVLQVVQGLDSLDFPAGSQYDYSNTGYVLLSMLIERISGQTFKQFMATRIFDPLGMSRSTVYDDPGVLVSGRVSGHQTDGEPHDYNAFTTGGGGIFSHVKDLFAWVKALSRNSLINDKLMAHAYTPATLTDGTLSYYGFGWRLDKNSPNIVQHSGSLAGFRTYLYRDMDRGHVVILLSNYSNDVGALNEIIVSLLEG